MKKITMQVLTCLILLFSAHRASAQVTVTKEMATKRLESILSSVSKNKYDLLRAQFPSGMEMNVMDNTTIKPRAYEWVIVCTMYVPDNDQPRSFVWGVVPEPGLMPVDTEINGVSLNFYRVMITESPNRRH